MNAKALRIGAAALLLSIATGWAESPLPAASTSPAKPMAAGKGPVTTEPSNDRYLKNPKLLNGCLARVAAMKGKECDLIFIGASIMERWQKVGKATWEARYAPRHALDFGVSGDQTQHVLWRLDHIDLKGLAPKVGVILIGSNNTRNTSEEIEAGVKAVVTKTQEVFPGIKIILIGITPSFRPTDIGTINQKLASYADNRTVFWLDFAPLMTPVTVTGTDGQPRTNWKGLGGDFLHPDASGYELWANAMEPLLSKVLAEGT